MGYGVDRLRRTGILHARVCEVSLLASPAFQRTGDTVRERPTGGTQAHESEGPGRIEECVEEVRERRTCARDRTPRASPVVHSRVRLVSPECEVILSCVAMRAEWEARYSGFRVCSALRATPSVLSPLSGPRVRRACGRSGIHTLVQVSTCDIKPWATHERSLMQLACARDAEESKMQEMQRNCCTGRAGLAPFRIVQAYIFPGRGRESCQNPMRCRTKGRGKEGVRLSTNIAVGASPPWLTIATGKQHFLWNDIAGDDDDAGRGSVDGVDDSCLSRLQKNRREDHGFCR